jgi:hypothetical protein
MTTNQSRKPIVVGSAHVPRIYHEILRRNLIYHVYPHPANDATWRANVEQVSRRLSLFNGKRLIAVSTGPDLVPMDAVRSVIGRDAEYLPIPNDTRLREAASFSTLLNAVYSTNAQEATFYAHTKGSSPGQKPQGENPVGIMYWRNSMYYHLLDGWHIVSNALRTSPAVGCFKIDWTNWVRDGLMSVVNYYPSGLCHGTWMFAGSFYWFRHDSAFLRPNWRSVPDDKYCCEAWPAGVWPTSEAHSVYQPWPPEQFTNPCPYSPETHTEAIGDGSVSAR